MINPREYFSGVPGLKKLIPVTHLIWTIQGGGRWVIVGWITNPYGTGIDWSKSKLPILLNRTLKKDGWYENSTKL